MSDPLNTITNFLIGGSAGFIPGSPTTRGFRGFVEPATRDRTAFAISGLSGGASKQSPSEFFKSTVNAFLGSSNPERDIFKNLTGVNVVPRETPFGLAGYTGSGAEDPANSLASLVEGYATMPVMSKILSKIFPRPIKDVSYTAIENKAPKKLSMLDPYSFQDTNQEVVIHSGWKKGNVFRHKLENAGDVFRGATRNNEGYMVEKLKSIWRYLSKYENDSKFNYRYGGKNSITNIEKRRDYGFDFVDTGIHPEDSFEYSLKHNTKKFDTLKQMWKDQPAYSVNQHQAKQLNLALLDKNFDKAKSIIKTMMLRLGEKLEDLNA